MCHFANDNNEQLLFGIQYLKLFFPRTFVVKNFKRLC